jgi:hypothetical protein
MGQPASKASFLSTVRAVLWGFLGVRRRSDFQHDTAHIKPMPLLVTGVVLAFLFVLGLMALVNWVVQ